MGCGRTYETRDGYMFRSWELKTRLEELEVVVIVP